MNTISKHVPSSLAINVKSPNEKLFDIMQQASAIAMKNGLIPEILDELLKDEI